MSSLSRLLEDFGRPGPATPDPGGGLDWDKVEALKAEAYESGYKAGWEDSGKQRDGDQARIAEDFARNLQDLSFTYHEAFSHVMKAMNPLLQQIVEAVLPAMAQQTLGARVVEQLLNMARTHGEQPATITVSPANLAAMESILEQEMPFPVQVTEDSSMGEGQVELRFGQTEQEIEMDEVLAGIGQAVAGFFQQHEKELKHG